ncbi:BBE domain-containing protein [Herbaspirillum rhizosphaerae]|uniref:BBE domain-containing protein n=1 Tax=Herbaspirillum rhizosphaerae TaxID=346179 RepID=A0ABW8ZDU4_9BURK
MKSCYADTLARLMRMKNKYDPANLFSFAQSIPSS